MSRFFTRKRATLVMGAVVIAFGLYFSSKIGQEMKRSEGKQVAEEREPWVTIFVHGSFGSLLGFLSASQVMSDRVEGTSYKKAVNRMRKDQFFYREQPLLGKGLIKVSPSFDLCVTGSKKLAAYPLLKAYEQVVEYARPGKERNFFYTFGWSGLLSQKRRCLEAIRFYNMLSEELEHYHKKGIFPKVRVLTHSHGGNVISYLAAIDEALRFEGSVLEKKKGKRRKALRLVRERFKTAPDKKEAKNKKGQKRWDYMPEGKLVGIDELILWGMPVQPETDHLFASAVFKNVYHFYSDEDLVQRLDWVSTKKGYSDRRFDMAQLCKRFGGKWSKEKCRLVQSRIVVSRKVVQEKEAATQYDNKTTTASDDKKKQESFWGILFSGGSIMNPTSQDPTHKELWFFSWKYAEEDSREFILAPFPVALFSPILVDLIKKKPGLNDVDINIAKSDDKIEFGLVKHNDLCLQNVCFVERKFLLGMKESVDPWRPEKASSQDVFNIVRRYADYL